MLRRRPGQYNGHHPPQLFSDLPIEHQIRVARGAVHVIELQGLFGLGSGGFVGTRQAQSPGDTHP